MHTVVDGCGGGVTVHPVVSGCGGGVTVHTVVGGRGGGVTVHTVVGGCGGGVTVHTVVDGCGGGVSVHSAVGGCGGGVSVHTVVGGCGSGGGVSVHSVVGGCGSGDGGSVHSVVDGSGGGGSVHTLVGTRTDGRDCSRPQLCKCLQCCGIQGAIVVVWPDRVAQDSLFSDVPRGPYGQGSVLCARRNSVDVLGYMFLLADGTIVSLLKTSQAASVSFTILYNASGVVDRSVGPHFCTIHGPLSLTQTHTHTH